MTETTIQPTFTLSAGCTGTPTYSCTDNSSDKNSNFCTANSDDYSRFDAATGELKMLSNFELHHRFGTYYIAIGVTVDGYSATCTTQVILTDTCQAATFIKKEKIQISEESMSSHDDVRDKDKKR